MLLIESLSKKLSGLAKLWGRDQAKAEMRENRKKSVYRFADKCICQVGVYFITRKRLGGKKKKVSVLKYGIS